ncbi:MAG: DUF6600 domain-containing protein [Myxococcota bacterium]
MIAPMSTARAFVRHFLLLAVVFTGVPAQIARAAETPAADSGWFDPQTPSAASTAGAPATPPPAESKPAPGDGRELPSLAPSPLLDRGSSAQASSTTQSAPDPEETNPRALSEFRSQLDPYGTWLQHPTYGTVWVPSSSVVGTGFYPYVSSGHWALDEGSNWIWVSDFSFGRVVFHYGRWVWIGGTGWAWIPGYRYAPAWVSWRVPVGSYAYVGWAPLGPSYLWFNGYAVSYWYGGYRPWVYCPSSYLFHHSVNYYVVRDRALVDRLGSQTRVYTAAQPRAVTGRSSLYTASPSLAAARVPANGVAPTRVRASSQMAGAVPRGRAEHFSDPSRVDRARPDFRRSEGGERFRSTPSPERFRAERFRSDPGSRPSTESWGRRAPARSYDGGSRPSFGGSRSYEGSRPSFSGSRPSWGGSRSFEGSRPSFGGSRPSFGGGGGSRPSFGGGGPSFGGSRPSFGGGGGSRPSFGGGGRR